MKRYKVLNMDTWTIQCI